jgi:dipeptidase E
MGILALGGGALDPPVCDWVAARLPAGRPKVVLLPTATADLPEIVVRFYELFVPTGCDASSVPLHGVPPDDARERIAGADAVLVTGGNTANALAIWRLHGIDASLRTAWERGALLWGSSAGMICWFEAGVTDSFRAALDGMRDGLGFLPGSACPHYDGEERRRPVYTRLVRDEGFPPGVAADDGTGLWYEGTELREVVAFRPGAGAYRVEPSGESPLVL